MTLGNWLILAAVCISGAISPGPSLAVIVQRTLLHGLHHGVVMSIAHALGVGVYAGLVIFGLGALVTQNELLFGLLRYAGAAFLLYLAWSAFRAGQAVGKPHAEPVAAASPHSLVAAARDGLFTALFNPKIALWFLALFSQFLEAQTVLLEKVGLWLLAVCIDGFWYLAVVLGLSQQRLQSWFERRMRLVHWLSALLMTAIAARVVFAA